MNQGGGISGRVFQSDGATPLSGAVIQATGSNKGQGSAISNADGDYLINGLVSGDYRVSAAVSGYVTRYYNGVVASNLATAITIISPDIVPNINFHLEMGGSISGHVYQADGQTPISGVNVSVSAISSGNITGTKTDSNGGYTVGGLASGEYAIKASTADYLVQYYNRISSAEAATRVTITATEDIPDIDFRLDLGGKISGRVFQADGATPLFGVVILAEEVNDKHLLVKAVSDLNGAYTLPGLESGDYRISAAFSNYFTQYYDNVTSSTAATLINVSAPGVVSNINFTLNQGGSISGRVYRADGLTPLYGASIRAIGENNGYGSSDSNGDYIISGLVSGSYRIRASVSGYLTQYYDNVTSSELASPVNVNAPVNIPNINFKLEMGGSISGHVYQADGITPISGVSVQAFSVSNSDGKAATTDSDGSYAIRGLASGNYRIYTSSSDYFTQYYNNVASSELATIIRVVAPDNTPNINFKLEMGGSISGHVYQADGITPISGTNVRAVSANGGSDTGSTTDSTGRYAIRGLTSGNYRIYTNTSDYLAQYYNNVASWDLATVVSVIAPDNTPNIDFKLDLGGTISGHVYQADGITPIPGAGVFANPVSNGNGRGASTDSNGYYTIRGLASGNYRIYSSATGYFTQYYNGVSSSGDATFVSVTAPANTPNIDFKLNLVGTISGHVYQADGITPISGTNVRAVSAIGGSDTGATTDSSGSYTIWGLTSGNYRIYSSATGYLTQYYDGVTSSNDATSVSVTAPANTPNIDFKLELVGTISGHVYQADGTTPISGAWVCANSVTEGIGIGSSTDSSGSYTIWGLTSGNYRIYSSATSYLTQYYKGVASSNDATSVSVTAPANTPNIDFKLKMGGSISGHVYQADGITPISGAYVRADPGGNGNGSYTDSAGSYNIRGLVTGNYLVRANASIYFTQYYDNATSSSTATPVVVTAPATTPNIDFKLVLGGTISGHVYQADGITPISGAYVYAYSVPDGNGNGSTTDSAGGYIIRGLASGNYRIYASATGYQTQYYNAATPVSVTAPANIPDIDFKLEMSGSISGHVYQADGITPISGAYVWAISELGDIGNGSYTDSAGGYIIRGLVSGNYRIYSSATGYLSQYYNGVVSPDAATFVSVTAPANTPDIDFKLEISGSISGHVYQVDGITPISGAYVNAYTVPGGNGNSSTTDSAGSYTIPCLASGNYRIYSQATGYFSQYYNGVSSSGAATFVNVTVPANTPNIDFKLDLRGDANGDGRVSMGDVTKLERIILALDPSTPVADVNRDGSINMGDVTKLERLILGLDQN